MQVVFWWLNLYCVCCWLWYFRNCWQLRYSRWCCYAVVICICICVVVCCASICLSVWVCVVITCTSIIACYCVIVRIRVVAMLCYILVDITQTVGNSSINGCIFIVADNGIWTDICNIRAILLCYAINTCVVIYICVVIRRYAAVSYPINCCPTFLILSRWLHIYCLLGWWLGCSCYCSIYRIICWICSHLVSYILSRWCHCSSSCCWGCYW